MSNNGGEDDYNSCEIVLSHRRDCLLSSRLGHDSNEQSRSSAQYDSKHNLQSDKNYAIFTVRCYYTYKHNDQRPDDRDHRKYQEYRGGGFIYNCTDYRD